MNKGSGTPVTPREPINTRKRAASQEKKSAVSDISMYLVKDSMATQKGKLSTKTKDKGGSKTVNTNNTEIAQEAVAINTQVKDMIKATEAVIAATTPSKEQSVGVNHDKEAVSANAPNATPTHQIQEMAANCNANVEEDTQEMATQTTGEPLIQTIKEMQTQLQGFEDIINDPKNGLTVQLAKTISRVNDLYSDIHGAVNGLKVKMDQVTKKAADNAKQIDTMQSNQTRMSALLDENKRLVQELQRMQGIVQKVSQQTHNSSLQIMDLTKRGMEQNLVLYGVDNQIEIEDPKSDTPMYQPKERCRHSALRFFKEYLNINIEAEDIWKAHRMGPPKSGKVRPLVVKVSYAAKELILEHMSALKGKRNPKTQQVFFISEQLPEGVIEMRKQTSARLKVVKENNEKLPKEQRLSIQVINDKILIGNDVVQPSIQPPQPSDLFLDTNAQRLIDSLQQNIVEIEPVFHRNSEFIALAAKVNSLEQMRRTYVAVAQRYPAADHIMTAYAFKDGEKLYHGACDDREYGAGARMKKLLFENQTRNTAVFVIRKFGGVHLGYDRFRIIEESAIQAIRTLTKKDKDQ